MAETEDWHNIKDALPEEIERCKKVLKAYEEIPTGALGASMIRGLIKNAEQALEEENLPAMLSYYQQLKEVE